MDQRTPYNNNVIMKGKGSVNVNTSRIFGTKNCHHQHDKIVSLNIFAASRWYVLCLESVGITVTGIKIKNLSRTTGLVNFMFYPTA